MNIEQFDIATNPEIKINLLDNKDYTLEVEGEIISSDEYWSNPNSEFDDLVACAFEHLCAYLEFSGLLSYELEVIIADKEDELNELINL
jgi:hypothetical protein